MVTMLKYQGVLQCAPHIHTKNYLELEPMQKGKPSLFLAQWMWVFWASELWLIFIKVQRENPKLQMFMEEIASTKCQLQQKCGRCSLPRWSSGCGQRSSKNLAVVSSVWTACKWMVYKLFLLQSKECKKNMCWEKSGEVLPGHISL